MEFSGTEARTRLTIFRREGLLIRYLKRDTTFGPCTFGPHRIGPRLNYIWACVSIQLGQNGYIWAVQKATFGPSLLGLGYIWAVINGLLPMLGPYAFGPNKIWTPGALLFAIHEITHPAGVATDWSTFPGGGGGPYTPGVMQISR